MYLKLEEEMLKRIQNITGTDYEAEGNFLTIDSVGEIIADLLLAVDRLEEEIEDIEQDRDDNYKPISYAEQVGYNERDFL